MTNNIGYWNNQNAYNYQRFSNGTNRSPEEVDNKKAEVNDGKNINNFTVSDVLDSFSNGDMTPKEVEKWLDTKNIHFTKSTNDGILTYEFKYDGKNYKISCNKNALESQNKNDGVQTYTLETLQKTYKLDNTSINKYFDVTHSEDGTETFYVIKPDSSYKNPNEIRNAIFMSFQNNLIRNNFVVRNN